MEIEKDTVKGLLHNLSVIESELKQIDEREVTKQAWDRISLAIEFAEDTSEQSIAEIRIKAIEDFCFFVEMQFRHALTEPLQKYKSLQNKDDY